MSTPHRNDDACTIAVPPAAADVLRLVTIEVVKLNHRAFKNLLDLEPDAQKALSVISLDAYAVLDALGWAPDPDATEMVDVPLTHGHIEQLHHRRYELGCAMLDRLDALEKASDGEAAMIHAEIDADRIIAETLDQLFIAYGRAAAA
jgi:hypothetical protein